MAPLRIIILAVLLYIGYRLIMSNFRKANDTDDKSSGKSDASLTDVLVEDPICHKLVPREQAVRTEIDGESYFFCSQECCDKYTADQNGDN